MVQKNAVLVHGAWADGSSWSNVIRRLPEKNLNVTAAQIPLTSLADDISVTRNLLNAQKGPYRSGWTFVCRNGGLGCGKRCAECWSTRVHSSSRVG